MGNEKWGMGNGEWEMKNREWGVGEGARFPLVVMRKAEGGVDEL